MFNRMTADDLGDHLDDRDAAYYEAHMAGPPGLRDSQLDETDAELEDQFGIGVRLMPLFGEFEDEVEELVIDGEQPAAL